MSEERWLPVVGLEGLYEVSDQGRVRSLDRIVTQPNRWRDRGAETVSRRLAGRMQPIHSDGRYLYVVLGRRRKARVHILVAEAFLGQRPDGLWTLHWDDDRDNCRLSNLRYGTPADNHDDRRRNGHSFHGSRNGFSKLDAVTVAALKGLARRYSSNGLAAIVGVSGYCVQALWTHTWPHVQPAALDVAERWLAERIAAGARAPRPWKALRKVRSDRKAGRDQERRAA